MDIARGDIANYFANEAITDSLMILSALGEREKVDCYQGLPREGREEHKCKHKNPLGAYILCGLTTARKDIDAAHRGPWGQEASAVEAGQQVSEIEA